MKGMKTTTATSKNNGSDQPPVRASITFNIGPGWKGTKSRDFPGRQFSKEDNELLQIWAKQFRNGTACSTGVLHFEDTRTVQLPPNLQGGRRRKPFIGATHVSRVCAYHWFRSTQKRLVDMDQRNGSTNRNKSSRSGGRGGGGRGGGGRGNNTYQDHPDQDQGTTVSINSTPVEYAIHSLVPATYDLANQTNHFIDVAWKPNVSPSFKEGKRSHVLCSVLFIRQTDNVTGSWAVVLLDVIGAGTHTIVTVTCICLCDLYDLYDLYDL